MHSPCRTLTLGVALALGTALATDVANLAAQARDPRIGTWKLNVAKSKFSPGPAPQSRAVKVELAGKGETATTEFVNTAGTRTTATYTANFDGKDYPPTAPQLADSVAL